VHGRHGRSRLATNTVAIEIEAGLAFGTGHHGTTRGCLLHFDRLLKRRRPKRALDVGCGAGVLAIAAAKVLKRKVWLGDLDSVAVGVANANAKLNGAGVWCWAVVSRGVENAGLREGAPYDLVFAPGAALATACAAARGGDERRRRGDRLRPASGRCSVRACFLAGARV
jgi:ribosomal protein L11 methyltransferase